LDEQHSKSGEIKLVSPDTVADLLTGRFDDKLNHFVVVDCRFPYEYAGGHIQNAVNLWTLERVLAHFFTQSALPQRDTKRTVVVFYCEFSSHRAPSQWLNARYAMTNSCESVSTVLLFFSFFFAFCLNCFRNLLILTNAFCSFRAIDNELIKDCDASLNEGLVYPNCYVLKGGYEAFFLAHPELCAPQIYVVRITNALFRCCGCLICCVAY
jgi:hypothetical protein